MMITLYSSNAEWKINLLFCFKLYLFISPDNKVSSLVSLPGAASEPVWGFNFMLLKLRLIFIWWQELLSAGLDIVAGLKEFLSDVQSAGVKPLWETARGRQNSAQSTTGEEGDKPPGSWRPAPHSPAEDIAAVKTVFVFTPQSFVLGQTQSQVWGAAAPFHYKGNTSHR